MTARRHPTHDDQHDPSLPSAALERTLLLYVLRSTWRRQLMILAVIAAGLPFYYLSLEIPKAIVNQILALGGRGGDALVAPRLFGLTLPEAPAIQLLAALSVGYLLTVLAYQLSKMAANIYKGLLGEAMVKRLRATIYALLHRLSPDRLRALGPGQAVAMVVMEAEPVGGFCGEIVGLPALQGGLLVTALIFIFVQDPVLGLGALALFPLQAWIFPRLVARRTALENERVHRIRALSDHVDLAATRLVAGGAPAGPADGESLERAIEAVRENRAGIYRNKFLTYGFLNFASQLVPFIYYAIGGWFVLEGRISAGGLVAIVAAYRDLTPPWEELLYWWQDAKIVVGRYRQLAAIFEPAA